MSAHFLSEQKNPLHILAVVKKHYGLSLVSLLHCVFRTKLGVFNNPIFRIYIFLEL